MDSKQLNKVKRRISQAFLDKYGLEALAAPSPPSVLYHYTTAAGLLGILQSRSLFATNVRYLNDASELIEGEGLFKELLFKKSLAKDHPLWFALTMLEAEAHSLLPIDHFVTCFCQNDDLLSQWRAYGAGGGFCIGFSTADLLALCEANGCILSKIAYEREQKVTEIDGYYSIIRENLQPFAGAELNLELARGAADVSRFILANLQGLFSKMKHETFREEREWRIVAIRPKAIWDGPILHFRETNGRIVPFLKISSPAADGQPTLPIVSITCGPGPTPELSKSAVHDLLDCCKYTNVVIAGSTVPLRV